MVGNQLELDVCYLAGRSHLPIVDLKRAAKQLAVTPFGNVGTGLCGAA